MAATAATATPLHVLSTKCTKCTECTADPTGVAAVGVIIHNTGECGKATAEFFVLTLSCPLEAEYDLSLNVQDLCSTFAQLFLYVLRKLSFFYQINGLKNRQLKVVAYFFQAICSLYWVLYLSEDRRFRLWLFIHNPPPPPTSAIKG
jgi:hypothetical protein